MSLEPGLPGGAIPLIPGLPTTFDLTLGVAFIGCIVATALFGIGTSQAFVFFQTFPHERPIIKWSVGTIWLFDTMTTVFMGHALYWWMVSHFGEQDIIIFIPWSTWAGILVASITDCIVRLFFCYRIWRLSKRNVLIQLPLLLMTLTIVVNGIALAGLGFAGVYPDVPTLKHRQWPFYLGFSLMAVADVYFAAWLTHYIRKTRVTNKTYGPSSVLNTILVFTVNTGTLTSILSILCLIAFAAIPNTLVYLACFFPSSKLYVNAMLATLNVRNWNNAGIDNAKVPVMTVNGQPTIPVAFADAPPPEVEIHIDREIIKTVTSS